MNSITNYLAKLTSNNTAYQPLIFKLNNAADQQKLNELFDKHEINFVHDEIYGQLQELVKSKNPSVKIKADEYPGLISDHLAGCNMQEYGVWVYYPWSKRLVHLLDEEEFVEVRTNRNRYKITRQEQAKLKSKKIGVIGLSVGQSIALTLAMERTCGEIRLADFDTAELSNLNRIRTGTQNLGLNKTIIAAREIYEIDPFLHVKIFNDGLNTVNIDEFFLDGGKLDLLIEVCDGLNIKIQSRFKARELHIPVVMDTNDKGMLDVERFDLEPARPILHGLADGLDPENIKDLSNEDKIPYILKMIGADTISTRLKASMLEVEQSINTWPQLASSVTLGGALTTDVCRRILLNEFHDSGRYYVDLEDLIKDSEPRKAANIPASYIGPPELSMGQMQETISHFEATTQSIALPKQIITEIIKAGIVAPSGGNSQPWKFAYNKHGLFIFHDEHYSYSLLDFNNLGSYVAIGAVIENISIKAASLGYGITYQYFPVGGNKHLVAYLAFNTHADSSKVRLEPGINIRVTNRDLTVKETLPASFYQNLQSSIGHYTGAELHIIEDESTMRELGKLLATAEMLRILHPRGHYDTFTNELRWTVEEINQKRDGLDVNSLGATNSELAGFKVASDTDAIAFIRQLNGGRAFTKMVNKSVGLSSSLGIITMPGYSDSSFLDGGRALERLWIEANLNGASFQPISQLVFMLASLKHGADALDPDYKQQLETLDKAFYNLLPQLRNKQLVFIFRLSKAGEPKVRSLRRPISASFLNMEEN